MNQEELDPSIDRVLNSFDGAEKAKPQPYILTRIQSRLNARATAGFWGKTSAFLSRPIVAGLGLFVFILVNIFVLANNPNPKTPASMATTTVSNYEFAIQVSSLYDIENQEP
ncbi:MAG: hypothetical protein JWQ27_1500 [Ferruginibacter sp.]|nr:hypothetical protein [Ferruginibacter sp.]